MTADRRSDCGAATVWAMSLVVLLLVALALVAAVADLLGARGRAATAADLAALAGARAAEAAGTDPCQSADRVARSNGARLTACDVVGFDVRVTVQVPPGRVVSALAARLGVVLGPVRMVARAGPPRAGGTSALS